MTTVGIIAACADTTAPPPGWELRLAYLISLEARLLDRETPVDTVPVTAPVAITVTSGGSSSCTRPGPISVRARESGVTFQVLDYVAVGQEVGCTRDIRPYPRTYLHTFFEAGDKTLRAEGHQVISRTLVVVRR